MQPIDTLIQARWIIPVEPSGRLLEDHALAIRDGLILDIVPRGDAERRYAPALVHELAGHALIPGLINAHTHAAMNLFKGLADDLALMDWLNAHIWPAESRWVSDAFVRDGTELAIAEMLRSGTTCFNDMYFFPDEVARTASAAGIRVVVGLIVLQTPSVWARDADEYIAKGTDVHDQLKNDALVYTAFAPHAPYTVQDAPLERIGMLAEELELPIHMHLQETSDEVARSVAMSGERPLARLDRLGLLSPRLLAVHMTQLLAEEMEVIAERGARVIHCPESNLKLASGLCPAASLLESGVNVALGTDGAASNNDLNMLGEMRTAALLAKCVAGRANALPAHQALEMATLNAARALGLETSIGSLRPGKAADIVAIDLAQVETQPTFDPVSQIVYSSSRHQVSDVWIAGRHVLKDRTLTTLDEHKLLGSAAAWRGRLKGN